MKERVILLNFYFMQEVYSIDFLLFFYKLSHPKQRDGSPDILDKSSKARHMNHCNDGACISAGNTCA